MIMSILKSQRSISQIEYEKCFIDIKNYLTNKINYLPLRYKKHFGAEFIQIITFAYQSILEFTYYHLDNKSVSVDRYRKGIEIKKNIEQIIIYSYIMWILSGRKNNKIKYIKKSARQYLCDLINKKLALLDGVMSKCRKDNKLDNSVLRMVAFESKDLPNYIKCMIKSLNVFQKKANQLDYFSPDITAIKKLYCEAIYYSISGNNIKISDENTYERRKKRLNTALTKLYSCNEPLFGISLLKILSEKELEIIADNQLVIIRG